MGKAEKDAKAAAVQCAFIMYYERIMHRNRIKTAKEHEIVRRRPEKL